MLLSFALTEILSVRLLPWPRGLLHTSKTEPSGQGKLQQTSVSSFRQWLRLFSELCTGFCCRISPHSLLSHRHPILFSYLPSLPVSQICSSPTILVTFKSFTLVTPFPTLILSEYLTYIEFHIITSNPSLETFSIKPDGVQSNMIQLKTPLLTSGVLD